MLVRLTGLTKSFRQTVAVHPLDLEIAAGDFLAILGPSGCGKTTLLRMMGGFETPTAGRVEIEGKDVTKMGPERRPTNMVFQGYGLFPHMNVRQNVGYGLKLRKLAPAEARARVDEMLQLVHLQEFAERAVHELSGGQQQRVALARALVMRPAVLLLDEPLGALDLKLREQMQVELKSIQRRVGITFIYVTHDQGEALSMSDRVAVFNQGRIEQIGTPADIYEHPRTRFVAGFVGVSNVLSGATAAAITGSPDSFSIAKFVVQGRVDDDQGMPVEGAALHIGKETAYTDSTGHFMVRFTKRGPFPLSLAPEEFITNGVYEIVSSPAQVSAETEDHLTDVQVVVRRMPLPQAKFTAK